jgi:hypothetical protein
MQNHRERLEYQMQARCRWADKAGTSGSLEDVTALMTIHQLKEICLPTKNRRDLLVEAGRFARLEQSRPSVNG